MAGDIVAREYAKNWFSMWLDTDFVDQPVYDKLLYQVLLGQSGTNDAGICPINLRKWRKATSDGGDMPSELAIKAALVRQERRRYVFTDEDTGEILIRSHIRRDQVYRQPAVMVAALRDLKACQSAKFAFVMLGELGRIELPEVKATSKQGIALRDSLKSTFTAVIDHLTSLSEGLVEPLPEPFAEDFPDGLPKPLSQGSFRPSPPPLEMQVAAEGSRGGSHRPPVVVEVEVEGGSSAVGHLLKQKPQALSEPAGSDHQAPIQDLNAPEQSPDDEPQQHKPAAYSDEFERWWSLYPRKEGKRAAYGAYKSARRRASAEDICAGTERYAEATQRTKPDLIKMPQGWLNADRFSDVPNSNTRSESVDWETL